MILKNDVHYSLSLCLWIISILHLAGCISSHFQIECPYLTHIHFILPPLTTGPPSPNLFLLLVPSSPKHLSFR